MNQIPAILVVDDEVVNRGIAKAVLKNAGWHVKDVETGAAAVTAVQSEDFALVLMDLQMPGLDGFDATRAIRSGAPPGARVPILAFTAMKFEDVRDRLREVGMDGHIAKPFTPDTLLKAVEPWRPDKEDRVARLSAIFGAAEIAELLRHFATQLADAIAVEEDDAARRTRAHKLAGASGTLGFADLSAAMLAVSEGQTEAWAAARIAARKVLAGLPGPSGHDDERLV